MKRIAFTGDIGFSSKYFRGTYEKEDLLHPDLVEYLRDTDYTVVNVEGCVCKGLGSADKPIVHANPPECIDFLKKINGNVWNLSNNHIMDCGRAGLEATLKIAAENGVPTIGVGLNEDQAAKPVILENDGADIGLISLTYEETPPATADSEGIIRWEHGKDRRDDRTGEEDLPLVHRECPCRPGILPDDARRHAEDLQKLSEAGC